MTFNVFNLVLLIALVYSMFSVFQSKTGRGKLVSGLVALAAVATLGVQYANQESTVEILPQIFPTVQSILRGSLDAGFVGDIRFLGQERKGALGAS